MNHANVIVDDSQYLDEPFFQDGPVSQAVNAASAAGVAVFSAAGNANTIVGGNNVSSYETPAFRPASCPASVTAAEGNVSVSCHDFDTTAGIDTGDDITLTPGGGLGIDLQWAQPWGSLVHHDYDAFLLDSTTQQVLAGSALDQDGGFTEPVEFFGYTNEAASAQTVQVVIVRYSGGSTDRLKFVMVGSSGITSVQYNTSIGGDIVGPTIFGHNGATTDGSTAAIAYNDSSRPEDYSSRGPVTLYYQPTPSTAALASPQVVDKPDFAATDDVQNVFFGDPSGSDYRFAGTSAAAPQAAAIGALLREYDPALTPAQVIATLRSTAQAVATNGTTSDVGGGYLDALAALSSVTPLPAAPQTITAASGNGQVALSWSAAAANPNFPVTGYVVTPTHNGVPEAPRPFGSAATSQPVTGLANGGTYTFTVTALSANGPGPESAPSAAVVVGLPGAPTAVSALPGGHAATVTWTMPPSASFGLPISGYVVSAYRNGAFVLQQSFNSPKTKEILSGVPVITTYQFSVKAINAFGIGVESSLSAPVNIGVPLAPVRLTASPGNGSAHVRWSAPVDNGSGIFQYRIYTSLNGGAESVFLTNGYLAHTFRHLKQGGHYTFRVTAENQRGIGLAATSVPVIVGAPARVVGATATAARKAAKVRWKAPANNGKPITGYVVTPYIGTVALPARVFHKTATTQVVTGLVKGQHYTFRVAAINARGTGFQSDPTKVVTPT